MKIWSLHLGADANRPVLTCNTSAFHSISSHTPSPNRGPALGPAPAPPPPILAPVFKLNPPLPPALRPSAALCFGLCNCKNADAADAEAAAEAEAEAEAGAAGEVEEEDGLRMCWGCICRAAADAADEREWECGDNN